MSRDGQHISQYFIDTDKVMCDTMYSLASVWIWDYTCHIQ